MAGVVAGWIGCAGASEKKNDALFPMLLTARNAWSGDVRAATVRVWADASYRAQNPQWQEDLDNDVAYANRVLIPLLGVGIAAEYRAWDHAQGNDLMTDLAALVQADAGDDAVWVIGVTAGQGDDTSFEKLGTAHLEHLIVRGYPDAEQRGALARAFPGASPSDRGKALIARRRHQTALVLLHQLAHTLDAQHDGEPNGMMSATYSPAAVASISEGNRTRMLSVLDGRLTATARYHEAEQLLARHDPVGAAAVLAPAEPLYPECAKPRVLRCRIELALGALDAATSAACDAAATTSAESAVAVAAARRGAADIAGAQRTLALAEERTASIAPHKQAATWLAIAGEYRELGAITRAENALAKAGTEAGTRGIAAWAATTRARYGIPRDGARWNLTIDDEAAAVAAVRNAISQVNASHWDAASAAINDAGRRWPALPGVLAAHCALDFRRDQIASARRLCEQAMAEGGSSWALYLLGTMNLEERGGNPAVGRTQLREAVARDPDLIQAWQKLARVLAKARATAELEQLRSDYHARFNASLSE